jgi:predicted secreted Zn-dependent protease
MTKRLYSGFLAACIGIAFLITGPVADARPKVKTKTQHYRVDGSDAAAIVSSMMKRHRLLGGHGRVGRTKMKRRIEWEFSETKKSCRVKSHTIRLDFTTQLPRHRSEKRLRRSLRKDWRAFAKHVKWHESQHRKIWLSCARRAEKKVNRARARNCGQLLKKLERIYKRSNAACDKRHARFDAKETRRLGRHPLIRRANLRK